MLSGIFNCSSAKKAVLGAVIVLGTLSIASGFFALARGDEGQGWMGLTSGAACVSIGALGFMNRRNRNIP